MDALAGGLRGAEGGAEDDGGQGVLSHSLGGGVMIVDRPKSWRALASGNLEHLMFLTELLVFLAQTIKGDS